jgi:predicted TIM-barrel fold metal-dependent hydrolase
LWASDYPHFDALFPGVVEELKERSLAPRAMQKVLGENAMRLYNLS